MNTAAPSSSFSPLRTGPLTLDPVPNAGLEWWFLQGHVTGTAGTKLRFMVAFFLVRGLTPEAREGALMLTHVLDENTKQVQAKSLVTKEALAFQAQIAAQVVRHHVTGVMPGMRALGLAQQQRDMAALMRRVPWFRCAEKGPRVSRMPFAASWDGVLLAHDTARGDLRLTLPLDVGRGFEAEITLPDAAMDMASDQLDARFGPGFWYQCAPRIPLKGRVGREEVTGEVWIDRQWGDIDGWLVQTTSPPKARKPKMKLLGWDWFGLSLEDGRDLLLNRHFDAATREEHAQFALLFEGKTARALPSGFTAHPLRHWRSKMTGARYPLDTRITLPDLGIEAQVTPLIEDQEIPFPGGGALWEGAMNVAGTGPNGTTISGRGRGELVGYGAVLSLSERLKRRIISKV